MPSVRRVPIDTPSDVILGDANLSRFAILTHRMRTLDLLVMDILRPLALPSMRILLGLLFIWFGGLKVAGVSPVKALVAGTIPWGDPNLVVPLLGCLEVILGLGLVTGFALRLVLPVLVAHLTGTFLTFVMLPTLMFKASDPLILTQDGEFVTKNLILISAALVLIVHNRAGPESASAPFIPSTPA
jgi:putative oxidoreductase